MEKSVKSNSVEKSKAIASTAHTWLILQIIFKKSFLENPVKLDLGIWF